jgi:Flp pilus assembly protein TadG
MRQLRKSAFLHMPHRARTKQRGVYALAFAVLMIPLIGVVGCAVDYARIVQYKSDLQNAVDEAALAGAAALTTDVLTSPKTNQVAIALATNYFNRAILPASLSVSAPTVVTDTSASTKLISGLGAYTVKVSASATVSNTLFAIFVPSVNLSATGTAAEPVVTLNTNLKAGAVSSQACDGNSLTIYQVPKTSDGTAYDYSISALNKLPQSAFVPVGQNANAGLPPIGVNQPLGVRMQNITDSCGATSPNQYGAQANSYNYFYSSLLENGMSPSEINDTVTYTVVATASQSKNKISKITVTLPSDPTKTPTTNTYTGNSLSLSTYTPGLNCQLNSTVASGSNNISTYTCATQYNQQNGSATALGNCSLYMQTGVSPTYVANLSGTSVAPSASSGHCFNPSQAGAQYAAPTCAQLSALSNGSSNAPAAVFWWNDGGGTTDDLDYNDAYFPLQCFVSGGNNGDNNTEVVLVQ